MSVGDLKVDVGDPAAYQQVTSSVRIGDIQASAFGASESGFGRHLNVHGQGQYTLRATLSIGDIVLSSSN
jgi:hypothetical protein